MADTQQTPEPRIMCERCNLEISDSDDYIVSRCNGKGCDRDVNCHQHCIEDMLLKSNIFKGTSQSAAQQKRQNKMAHAPHAALKAQKCPREGCTGRVQDTDRVVQTKRKKIIEASLAAPAAIPVPAPKPTGKGKKTHKAPAASQGASGPTAPGQPPPVAKQKPQLNLPAKPESGRPVNPSLLTHMPARVKPNRNLNPYATLASANEDDDDQEEEASQASQQPVPEPDGISVEEVDAAIREGILPDDFNTIWCTDFLDKGKCLRGRHCPFAHSLQQLRIDAAIERGTVQADFKTNFCANQAHNGSCPHGIRCQHAHSAQELRVSVLIQKDVLDEEYHVEFCQAALNGGKCEIGLACSAAHKRSDLRAEAAVLHDKRDESYRFALCENWYRRGTCSWGIECGFAHGIHEVRVCSASHFQELGPNYKTQRCSFAKCDAPWKCHFYHSEQDRRKPIVKKTVYCPIWKELGGCAMGDKCHWAHGPEDLDVRAFKFDFPLASGQQKHGDWEQVDSRRPNAVRTGKQKGRQRDGTGAGGGSQHSRGSPAAGHQASFHPRQALPSEPVAVQQNKMPAQAEAGKRGRHRGGRARKKPQAFYKLCHEFEQKGHCTVVDCEYAHGQDMLDTRNQDNQGKSAAQRAPRINPATATLSTASIQLLKNQKLDMCVAGLAELGFKGRRDVAKFVGGELDAAADLVTGGRRPAQAVEVDVQGEIASAISMAFDSNWSLPFLEEQIKEHKGNVNAVFHEQMQAVESVASSSGGWTPRSEASTSVAGTPHTPWQEEAALQVDKSGKAVKINADGFPDIDSLDLEQDQTQLRYEAYKAVHQDRAKHASAETAAPRQSQQAQQHQPSSSRTPFADARPQSDDRYDESAAAQASARTSESLAAMGVAPTMVGAGSGPSHAAPQPIGFAAMAPPQGTLAPPPPFQRNVPSTPPATIAADGYAGSSSAYQSHAGNGYGANESPPSVAASQLNLRAAAAEAANGYGYAAQAPADFPSDIFGPPQHSNGIAAHPEPKQAQRGRLQTDQVAPMPKAGDWNKELWASNNDNVPGGFHWVQQQQQQQNPSSGLRSGQEQQSQQRQPAGFEFEQMPSIPAQHAAAAPKQKAAPAEGENFLDYVFF